MREFAIYDPEEFGMHGGSPAADEAYVIIKDLNSDKSYLTYIITEDIDAPPVIDLDSLEEIQVDYEEKQPAISHISMRKDGTIIMDSAEEIFLNEKQNELLAFPSTLFTLEGRMVTQYNGEYSTLFTKDLTLEGIPATKLDYTKTTHVIKERYPELLKMTHERYGNKFPYFPFAKYYEDKEKLVVFVTKKQALQMNDEIISGNIPFYKNYYLAESWDINNTYGVCIIDEETYKLRLISPKSLNQYKETELNRSSENKGEER